MKNSFSFLAKHISWKYIVLILILIYIILLTFPYLPHKTVSEEYKEKDAAAEYYSDTSGPERFYERLKQETTDLLYIHKSADSIDDNTDIDTSGTERIAYITDNNDALFIGSV